jgi:glutaredoxin
LLLLITTTMITRSFAFAPSYRLGGGRSCVFVRQHRTMAASITGPVYTSQEENAPMITLFTKEACSLCDEVKEVLLDAQIPAHSLQQVDITDADKRHYWETYKYDIPVVHVNGMYWTKHRLTVQEAMEGLQAVQNGSFTSPPGEPKASTRNKEP